MCCCNDPERVKDLLTRFDKAKGKKLKFWKIYSREIDYWSRKKHLRSVVYIHAPGGTISCGGVIWSNAQRRTCYERKNQHIYRGIHVYISRGHANRARSCGGFTPEHVVSVWCSKEDLLGVGGDCGVGGNTAVFKKIEITQRAFDRATK